jgi:hypothetical protein
VYTLIDHASFPESVQVCYGIDVDDVDTASVIQTALAGPQDVIWTSPESLGYGGFHVYANELAARATGDWLFLWNDDALMRTDGWDDVIRAYEPRQVLSARNNHAEGIVAFPIVPRIFVEALGHFSLNPHTDTWWQYLADSINRLTWVDIDVLHDRYDMTGNNYDETYSRTRAQSLNEQTAHRFWTEAIPLIEEDKQIILDLLQQLGDECESSCNG